jgi:hypothetical protein
MSKEKLHKCVGHRIAQKIYPHNPHNEIWAQVQEAKKEKVGTTESAVKKLMPKTKL